MQAIDLSKKASILKELIIKEGYSADHVNQYMAERDKRGKELMKGTIVRWRLSGTGTTLALILRRS